MHYIKLIALKLDDFLSTIVFERNYSPEERALCDSDKLELDRKGYVCILAGVDSDLVV